MLLIFKLLEGVLNLNQNSYQ